MEFQKRQKMWWGVFYSFCSFGLCLLCAYFYLVSRSHRLDPLETAIPLFFFVLAFMGGFGTLKYKVLELSNCYIDPVTGGSNEFLFQQEFQKRTAQKGEFFAFLYINIKKFSLINSEYGWAAGDHILKSVYTAFKEKLLPGESIARVNTDTYYLLLRIKDEEALKARIYELDDAVYFLEHLKIDRKLFLSIGAYILKDASEIYADAVDRANFCRTHSADASDRNSHFEVYNHTIHDKREYHKKLLEMAQPALEKKHFKMFLQPKYELEHETLAGAEALVRWQDPEEGMMPVYEFVPLFEKNGFMRQIDYFIFESALELIEKWMDEGIEPLKISVNLSKSHFSANNFFEERVLPIFERHRVPRQYIEFEISESIMLDNSGSLIKFVRSLREQGFECSMDDFGSGYSSLNMLKSLPVSTIKLDQKLFSEEEKERGKIVSRGIIQIARQLDMKVVAEGVETREYVDFLKEQKCDMIQGYYFGRPMPVDEFCKRM